MQLLDRLLHVLQERLGGLDQEELLGLGRDLPFPAVDGADHRHDVDTRCFLALHQRLGDLDGFFFG